MKGQENRYVLSIVTVTYNAGAALMQTVESVLRQSDYSEQLVIEHVFVDGESSDGTVERIREYMQLLQEKGIACRLVSEKDEGIYDAMNKGIRMARGKWVYLLNAGDRLYDAGVFRHIEPRLLESDAAVLYGNYIRKNRYLSRQVLIPELEELKKTMIFCHQAVFIRRELHRHYQYNTDYRIVADYDLLLRMYLQHETFEKTNEFLVIYDTEGMSAKHMTAAYKEIFRVRKSNGLLSGRICQETMRYRIGIAKRMLLGKMPQGLRWFLYERLKRLK